MAYVEHISDGLLRLHGPSGAYHDFDPYGPVVIDTVMQPKKGKSGIRVSVSVGGRTAIYPMNNPGQASSFKNDAERLIRKFYIE
jgi:hypothetical protein